jgi:hypothetical protein
VLRIAWTRTSELNALFIGELQLDDDNDVDYTYTEEGTTTQNAVNFFLFCRQL